MYIFFTKDDGNLFTMTEGSCGSSYADFAGAAVPVDCALVTFQAHVAVIYRAPDFASTIADTRSFNSCVEPSVTQARFLDVDVVAN
jgi:hypothetical protein